MEKDLLFEINAPRRYKRAEELKNKNAMLKCDCQKQQHGVMFHSFIV